MLSTAMLWMDGRVIVECRAGNEFRVAPGGLPFFAVTCRINSVLGNLWASANSGRRDGTSFVLLPAGSTYVGNRIMRLGR